MTKGGPVDGGHESIPARCCKVISVDEIVGEALHGEASVGRG